MKCNCYQHVESSIRAAIVTRAQKAVYERQLLPEHRKQYMSDNCHQAAIDTKRQFDEKCSLEAFGRQIPWTRSAHGPEVPLVVTKCLGPEVLIGWIIELVVIKCLGPEVLMGWIIEQPQMIHFAGLITLKIFISIQA